MKSILLTLCILCIPAVSSGEDIDVSRVMRVAYDVLGTDDCSIVKQTDAFLVVQRNNTTGYVVVRTCQADRMVIGCSDDSCWDEEQMPPALTDWLRHIENTADETANLVWQQAHTPTGKTNIAPLLTSHWHQDSPYNDLTPVIEDGNVKTAAGCVAIAAAQIAYYWRRDNPKYTLEDTPTYPYGAAPVTYSVPEGSPNNWELMKDTYTDTDSPESRYAAAQLCYVIGTTSYLHYASSTGGSIFNASNAIYSQYELLSDYVTKKNYNQQEWDGMIYNNLKRGRPILYAGDGSGGHAFVVDGYDSDKDLYHVNFGWGGAGDGYYLIDDSELALGGYYKNQSVVCDIHPTNRNINAVLDYSDSMYEGCVDVCISISNSSTLDLDSLQLFVGTIKDDINDLKTPAWQYVGKIESDGAERRIVAKNIRVEENEPMTFYLTDECKYVICQQHVHYVNEIATVGHGESHCQSTVYDTNGCVASYPRQGLHIVRIGDTYKKILTK